MKNSNDTIGNRTRYLPACSAVHQPTAPPRALYLDKWEDNTKMDLQEVGRGERAGSIWLRLGEAGEHL